MRGYEDTFSGARNIKFERGECSCEPITKGSIAKNPFNFRNFSASQVAIYLNGEMPAPSLNFASIKYTDGYRSLFATAGLIDIYDGLVLRG